MRASLSTLSEGSLAKIRLSSSEISLLLVYRQLLSSRGQAEPQILVTPSIQSI